MLKAFLFALLFVVVGGVVFALVAPLIFPHANHQKLGAVAFPIIAPICGIAGFLVGWSRRNRS